LANIKLDGRLTARVDEHDVVQSVLRSFFGSLQRGRCCFESWDDVWALLVVLTTRKCVKQSKVHFAGRRDARRDVDFENESLLGIGQTLKAISAPAADHALLLAEASERLFAVLTDREKEVLALAISGMTVQQIGLELGRTQRTVRRLLSRVRERLERMMREAA
jgi:RNA polymerase sigma-70 factor (ECF subfamily)